MSYALVLPPIGECENDYLLGMDCSGFDFYHSDLGPGDIIMEDIPVTESVGIINWEVSEQNLE